MACLTLMSLRGMHDSIRSKRSDAGFEQKFSDFTDFKQVESGCLRTNGRFAPEAANQERHWVRSWRIFSSLPLSPL